MFVCNKHRSIICVPSHSFLSWWVRKETSETTICSKESLNWSEECEEETMWRRFAQSGLHD